jgi:hypothetical protein
MQNTKHNKIQPSKGAKTEPQPQTSTCTGPEDEKAQLIQSIRSRCLELIHDARGVVPGLRIVGVFSLHDAIAEQTAASLLCYDTLGVVSQRLTDDLERKIACARDDDEEDYICDDCRAEMEQIAKQQKEELAEEEREEQP